MALSATLRAMIQRKHVRYKKRFCIPQRVLPNFAQNLICHKNKLFFIKKAKRYKFFDFYTFLTHFRRLPITPQHLE